MELEIFNEQASDYREVEWLTREAFWNLHQPGCDEHLLIHKLRQSDAFVPQLSFIAQMRGRTVGSIVYSLARLCCKNGEEQQVLTFGPLSVLPSFQNRGVGSALVRHSLQKAQEMGFSAVIIYGAPGFYSRLGFEPAEHYNILTRHGQYLDALQIAVLDKAMADTLRGRFIEDDVFELDPQELAEFEKRFPTKMKFVTVTQHAFQAEIKKARTPENEEE